MRALAENPILANKVGDAFKEAIGAEKVEEVELDGKRIVVVDVEPVVLPFNHEHGVEVPDTPEQAAYRKFYNIYEGLLFGGAHGENISSKGYTDIGEVRTISRDGDVVYLIPKVEFAKLAGRPLRVRNEKISDLVSKWSDVDDDLENKFAANALAGRENVQLTAVMAGLKPLSVELSFGDDPVFQNFLSTTGLRSFTVPHGQGEDGRGKDIVYNPVAVQRVIDENPELFEKIGLAGKSSEDIIISLVDDYLNSGHEQEINWDRTQAFGLFLGYDKTSCQEYRNNDVDWSKTFMPPDHWDLHSMNAVPFNFYGVDYWIKDAENNPDFKNLKVEYEALVLRVESLLGQGFSPAEVLKEIGKDTPEVLKEIVVETGKKVEVVAKGTD